MKNRHIICLVIILFFAVFCFATFKNSLNPYVSFAEARTANKTVQVRGKLVENKLMVPTDGKSITFRLTDETGEEARISYIGVKPAGMEDAESIVVIGKYHDGEFTAAKLLVKCPSKYQERVKQ